MYFKFFKYSVKQSSKVQKIISHMAQYCSVKIDMLH